MSACTIPSGSYRESNSTNLVQYLKRVFLACMYLHIHFHTPITFNVKVYTLTFFKCVCLHFLVLVVCNVCWPTFGIIVLERPITNTHMLIHLIFCTRSIRQSCNESIINYNHKVGKKTFVIIVLRRVILWIIVTKHTLALILWSIQD